MFDVEENCDFSTDSDITSRNIFGPSPRESKRNPVATNYVLSPRSTKIRVNGTSLGRTSIMKLIPSGRVWLVIQTRTLSPEIASKQKRSHANEREDKKAPRRPVGLPYTLLWWASSIRFCCSLIILWLIP
jgi:hypothetical protein